MPRVILFEDDPIFIEAATRTIATAGHELVAHEDRVQNAFSVMGDLATGAVTADIIVVDGTLKDDYRAGITDEIPTFTYEDPERKMTVERREGLLRRKHSFEVPRLTVVSPNYSLPQAHGRAIVEIVRSAGIDVKTIGFSASPMRDREPLLDIPVDVDVPLKTADGLQRAFAQLV